MIPVQRSLRDRILLGVCGGVAERIGVHAGWFRLAFIVAGLASGVGILIYVALSLVMPPPGGAELNLTQRMRGNLQELRFAFLAATDAFERWREQRARMGATDDARTLIGIVAVVGGLFVLLWSFGLFWWLDFWRTTGIVVVLVGLGLLMPRARRRTARAAAAAARRPRSILAAPALVIGLAATFGIILTGAAVEVLDDEDGRGRIFDVLDASAARELDTLRERHEQDQQTITRLERRIDVLEAWPGMLALMGAPPAAASMRQRPVAPAPPPPPAAAEQATSPWPLGD